MRKLKFKLVRNVVPLYGTSYTTCIGCDSTFNEMLNIKEDCIKQTERVSHTAHNSIRDTSSSSSTSNASQSRGTQRQQSTNTRTVRDNFNTDLIGTSGTSNRSTQNHGFNIPQSNKRNTANDNMTISDNRETTNVWLNTNNSNNSENRSDQRTFRNPHNNTNNETNTWGNIDNNAEIMCNCHETAIRLVVRKEGPNKGRL